jgi:ribose transport system ATP-binding protein
MKASMEIDTIRPPAARPAPDALLSLAGVAKTYGSTRAAQAIDLDVAAGEVVGLVGANGAGKSTLMRIVCGVTEPDTGKMALGGRPVDLAAFSPRAARDAGIRIVWQELSLSPNLSVAENFYVEQPQFARLSPLWLADYHRLARDSIERIFPGARIPTSRLVADLTLAERQMVEIARAASDPRLKLLILDEPTSSLGAERSAQLRQFVREQAGKGVAVVFISHKLAEVLDISDRVVAMRNGRLVWQKPAGETSIGDLVEAMGGAEAGDRSARPVLDAAKAGRPVRVRLSGDLVSTGGPIELSAGEIVGLAGLEGSGQRDLLQRLFARPRPGEVERDGEVRYVSGDRQGEGVFPLWSVLENIGIGRVARLAALTPVKAADQRPLAASLAKRLALDESRFDAGILDLSGGNQQKVLVARALTDEAEIILLDDPTRGVDIAAKRDFYRLVREIAAAGRLVIWHSTEDLEFLECNRVLVFARGEIVTELAGDAISEDRIVAASFQQPAADRTAQAAKRAGAIGPFLLRAIPFLSLVMVFAAMSWMNPLVASSFGIELLLAPAVTLVLIALAQMFVVGGSEIDLGIGSFTGLVNVISATLLVTSPLLGFAALLAGLAGYCLIAVLIHARAIPAIVVTLGASFIWAGFGQTLQPSPGGSSPQWLTALFTWNIPGIPTPLALILIAAAAAFLIDRSPAGTVLRAFGSSPLALRRGGWSPLRYGVMRYAIACLFAMAAGLYVTAANNASDINAGGSFTLLGIAAVVIGGCQLLGGFIAPLGVVAGAVTLSLIGALLASLGVSTNYNAAVQGALLIVILGLQAALVARGRRHG